jgi:hypothetical protein
MGNGEQKSFPTDSRSSSGRSNSEPLPLPAQIAALRERIAKMVDAVIDNVEPASVFKIRKD